MKSFRPPAGISAAVSTLTAPGTVWKERERGRVRKRVKFEKTSIHKWFTIAASVLIAVILALPCNKV